MTPVVALRTLTLGLTLSALSFRAAPAPGVARAVSLTITPDDATGIYEIGQKVGWTIRPAKEQPAIAGRFTYTIRRNNLDVIKTGELDLSSGSARIETSLAEPAMLLVEIRPPAGTRDFGSPSTGGVGRMNVGAAVAPTKLMPSAPRPRDFDAFWEGKIAQLKRIPENAVLTPGESGNPDIEYFTIRMDNVNGAHVYGQLAKPKRAGKFPALLVLQWASAPYPLQKSWVLDRAAEGWLALNIEPHDVPSDMPQAFYDALPTMIKRYASIGQTNRDENYFLQMYLGDYRAVEYLAGRRDWDGRTMVVSGTSMGGQQSLAVAGLSFRVSNVIVNEPAGADALGPLHGRAGGYPNWDISNPKVVETAPYFDTVNFASRITATSLVAMGFIDEIAPPVGIWAAFNQIKGPKEAAPMVESHHNNYATPEQQRPYTSRSAEWLNALVSGQPVNVKAPVKAPSRAPAKPQ